MKPCIVVIHGVVPSDLVSIDQFFINQLTEGIRDPIEEAMREAVLIREKIDDNGTSSNDMSNNISIDISSTFTERFVGTRDAHSDTQNNKHIQIDKLPQQMSYLRLPIGGCQVLELPPPTRFKCWYCDLRFSTHPWFIPTDMREERNNVVVLVGSGVSGNFCSDVCAYGWLPQLESSDRYSQLLHNEIQARSGKLSFRIPDPLPKTKRVEYGGIMSEEEFREEIKLRSTTTKSN